MCSDEQQIRQLVADWMAAAAAGDSGRVPELMADDVVFLTPGREPMRKGEFAVITSPQAGRPAPRFEGESEIQEVQVAGDWAFMYSRLKVVATLPDGAPPVVRTGHTLSVLRREGGRWRLARDANLLAPVAQQTR